MVPVLIDIAYPVRRILRGAGSEIERYLRLCPYEAAELQEFVRPKGVVLGNTPGNIAHRNPTILGPDSIFPIVGRGEVSPETYQV